METREGLDKEEGSQNQKQKQNLKQRIIKVESRTLNGKY